MKPFRHFILFRPAHAYSLCRAGVIFEITKPNLTVAIEPQSTDTYMYKKSLPSLKVRLSMGPEYLASSWHIQKRYNNHGTGNLKHHNRHDKRDDSTSINKPAKLA